MIDQLIPANDTGQVLGIFTSAGNVQSEQQADPTATSKSTHLIATISADRFGWHREHRRCINTLTIVGGRIQNTIQNIGATTRNVLFDRRFLTGFAPPWFPSTSSRRAAGVGLTVTASWKGTQWLNETNSQ